MEQIQEKEVKILGIDQLALEQRLAQLSALAEHPQFTRYYLYDI